MAIELTRVEAAPPTSALEIALSYIGRGWAPVPVPYKKKRPVDTDWQKRRITTENASLSFNCKAQNVGVQLGEASGGLADVDLDSAEAVAVANYFLPRTQCFGRASKPRSHWLYQSNLWQTETNAAVQFKFSTGKGKERKDQMILELRIGGGGMGAQTVFPGSVHESGEPINWDEAAPIAKAEGGDLKQYCARAASSALLAANFPLKGARHDAGLTLGGFLFRCGFGRPDAQLFAEAVTVASGQGHEKAKDVRKAAGDAWDAAGKGNGARGLPMLKETFGEDVAKHVAKWLGFKGGAEEARNRGDERTHNHEQTNDFVRGDSGQILKGHPGNITSAIEKLGVSLKQNEFSVQPELSGLAGFGPILNDAGAAQLRVLIHETFGFLPSKDLYEDVLIVEAHKNRFHPVREYLNMLKWDGRERLKIWLSYYLGAEHSPYVETIGRSFFVALVARIFNPGCKQDYMLILEGPQGALKSMACEAITGQWFSDHLPELREGKDVSQHLQGKWLIEIGELSAMSKAEAATLKAFITRRTERYRPSYGRREVVQPRQCIFVGTTNDEVYLKDPTGGRRFWPIKIGSIDLEALAKDRDQLFAEAVHLFKSGAKWWPEKDFESEHIKPQQAARYAADPWQDIVAAFLQERERVTVGEIARDALFIQAAHIGTAENRRIIQVLTSLGWTQKRSHGVGWYIRVGV